MSKANKYRERQRANIVSKANRSNHAISTNPERTQIDHRQSQVCSDIRDLRGADSAERLHRNSGIPRFYDTIRNRAPAQRSGNGRIFFLVGPAYPGVPPAGPDADIRFRGALRHRAIFRDQRMGRYQTAPEQLFGRSDFCDFPLYRFQLCGADRPVAAGHTLHLRCHQRGTGTGHLKADLCQSGAPGALYFG